MNLKNFIKKNSVIICTITAAVGAVATVVSAITATPKAYALLKEKGDDMKPSEIIKTALPAYVPSIFICLSTVMSIYGIYSISDKQKQKITTAYLMMRELYEQYRNTNILMFGEDNDKKIIASVQNERNQKDYPEPYEERLYYLEGAGEDGYFTSTPADVMIAQYEANRILAMNGSIQFNEFTQLLGVKSNMYGEDNGWSLEVGYELYNKPWIDFYENIRTLDDGLEVIEITCDPEPCGYPGQLTFPDIHPF